MEYVESRPKAHGGALWKLVIVGTLFVLNLAAAAIPITVLGLVRLIIPVPQWKRGLRDQMIALGNQWVANDAWTFETFGLTEWQINGREQINPNENYLVIGNHQSATDICTIFHALNYGEPSIPFLRFFIKNDLKWVPILGWACQALDMPFMKRYSRAYLEKHPEKRGEDFKTTREMCRKLRGEQFAIFNFSEGTRQTPAKYAKQNPPYKHLLQPKAGGLAMTLNAVGDELDAVLDVTIIYPHEKSISAFAAGRIPTIIINIRKRPIPAHFPYGDYAHDEQFQAEVRTWINGIWAEKDQLIDTYLSPIRVG